MVTAVTGDGIPPLIKLTLGFISISSYNIYISFSFDLFKYKSISKHILPISTALTTYNKHYLFYSKLTKNIKWDGIMFR